MSLRIDFPEVFGVTEDSLTLYFDVADDSGPAQAPATVRLNGEVVAVSQGGELTRHVRVEGLTPDTEYRIALEVDGASSPAPQRYFPESVRTLAAPSGRAVGSFATLNDLHFGEPRFGGTLTPDGEYGEETPENPAATATDSAVPYWLFMNQDAVSEINSADVDMTIIKGDIADRGLPEQFEIAARTFAGFEQPHHAFLGNHDFYARNLGQQVDGYAILGQEPAPRTIDHGGWRLILLDTVEPGEHHGVFPEDRLSWLAGQLEESRDLGLPTLLFKHHHPVPPEHAHSYPNTIGIRPEHSLRIFDLIGRHEQVKGVLIGHTHRNRVRFYPASGSIPFIEVHCAKDYPGGFARYTLYDDGSFRQEARRTSSARALAHSGRCRGFFNGGYRDFSMGPLDNRSFAIGS